MNQREQTATERELARRITEDLNRIPEMRELLARFGGGRQPRYRYWETPDGAMYLYTTEKFSDGKYGSAVYRPVGKGSRSGKKNVQQWKPTREVHHTTRKAAKARAHRLYQEAKR